MTFSTIEPARAGVASEIRYSPITHGYHLFSPTGEMLGNVYGYESYLQAERADSGRCLTCGKPTESVICADCVTTAHRCAAGHALEDDGACETCGDIEDTDQARLRDAEADEAEPWEADLVRALFACRACGGEHHTQQCPDIRARLFADEPAVLLIEAPYALLEA